MKILQTTTIALALIALLFTTTLSAQCSNCASGSALSSGNFQPDFSPDWTVANSANNTAVGRDFLLFAVEEGIIYRWTTVGPEDLSTAEPGLAFNTELTLRVNCDFDPDKDGFDENMLEYNDNGLHRNQSLIEWKATYSGFVTLLVTQKTCTTSLVVDDTTTPPTLATTSVFWQRIGSSECANNYRNSPTGTFSTPAATPAWTPIGAVNAVKGGDYQHFDIQKGRHYTWTNEGDTSFDSQFTLFKENSDATLTFLAYNDDDILTASTQSTLEYTAQFTGTVQMLTSQYRCTTCQPDAFGSDAHCSFTTLQWQMSDCPNCIDDKNSGSPITPDTSEDNTNHLNSGDYLYFNVVAGKTYRWRLDDSNYMVTVREDAGGGGCTGDFLAHGKSVIWKASFTGTAEVLISRIGACTNAASGDMRLYYKIVDDPAGRFIVNPDDGQGDGDKFIGIVLDTSTNTFYKDLSAATWVNALQACEDLVVTSDDSHDPPVLNNWRLVTINELSSVVDYDKTSPASFYPGISSATYWASTTIHNSTDFAWSVIMDDGRTYRAPKTESFSVICAAGATIAGEVQKDFPMQTRHVIGWACDKGDPSDQLDVQLTFYDKNGSRLQFGILPIKKDIDADMVFSDFPADVDPSEIPSQAYIDSQCGGTPGEAHMFYYNLTRETNGFKSGFTDVELTKFTADKAPFSVKVEAEVGSGWHKSYFEVVNSPQQFLLVDDCGDSLQSGDPSQANPENCDDGNAVTEECNYGENSCTVCNNTCHEAAGALHVCGDSFCDGSAAGVNCDGTGLTSGPEECDDGNTENEHCTTYGTGTCTICNYECKDQEITAPHCGDGVCDGAANLPHCDGAGLVVGAEECDDNNSANIDSCLNTCKINTCGDGYRYSGVEDCDNGADNGVYNNDCNISCDGVGPFCGDAVIDLAAGISGLASDELCDNGTAGNGVWTFAKGTLPTSCAIDCMGIAPYCGDANKDEGHEECDLGTALNNGHYAKCKADCRKAPQCGDGIKDLALSTPGLGDDEECDDGTNNGKYGFCNKTCTGTVKCGDGDVFSDPPGNEVCDWLIFGAHLEWRLEKYEACTSFCKWANYCGDTILDGPTGPTDGIAVLDGEEMCDNGAANVDASTIGTNTSYESACVAVEALPAGDENNRGCRFTHYCGDGVIDNSGANGINGNEECDAGSDNSPNAWCTANCKFNVCGDGFRCDDTGCGIEGGTIVEQCDDSNSSNSDSCVSGCIPASCQDTFRKTSDSPAPWSGWIWNGDGSQAPNEECDDGNAINTDSCTVGCKAPNCGDNITKTSNSTWNGDGVNPSNEECDMGLSNDDNNACLSTCKKNICHDGHRCSGTGCDTTAWSINEECDDGNSDNTDGCVNACVLARCGDSHQKDGNSALWNGDVAQIVNEICEDGNDFRDNCADPLNPGEQVCTETCVLGNCNNTCGDGTLDPGEQCDNGAANSNNAACTKFCQNARCGDGYTYNTGAGTEQCDDANGSNSDACLGTCKNARCGDGFIYNTGAGTEECDDSNSSNTDSCVACKNAFCGDGHIEFAVEQCDLGATVNADNAACRSTCLKNTCHDGFRCTHSSCITQFWSINEECDDKNTNNADGCVGSCDAATCGDSYRKTGNSALWNGSSSQIPNESCDSGAANGTYNNCNTTCSAMGPYCGDSSVNGPETCDDGTNSGSWSLNSPGKCNSNCLSYSLQYCGNGAKESSFESCDSGANNGSYGYCKTDCSGMGPYCGDGSLYATYSNITASYAQEGDVYIGDNGTVYSNLWVTHYGTVNSLSYSIGIDHSYKGDLKVDILAPDGTTLNLHNSSGGSANNVYLSDSTTFFNGKQIHGTWKLRVYDGAGGDTGYIRYFRLTINRHSKTSGETCDQGSLNGSYQAAAPGRCNSNCAGYGSAGYCSDGVRNGPESCDQGSLNGTYQAASPGHCNTNCAGTGQGGYCGDGSIQSPESCDRSGLWTTNAECGCNSWGNNCERKWYRCDSCVTTYDGCRDNMY